jgi:hypothetical protein
MDTTVSPQIKLIALLALVAAAGMAVWMFVVPHGSAETAAPLPPPAVVKPKPVAPAAKTPAAKATKAKAAAPAKAKTAVLAKAKPKVTAKSKPVVKAKPKPKPRPVVAANGLPTVVNDQLRRYDLVVVALYADGASVDRMVRDEAQAGAGDADAGFAALEVSRTRSIGPVMKKLGTIDAPAIVVFGRDGEVKARLDGFADRLLVAQLASSARLQTSS